MPPPRDDDNDRTPTGAWRRNNGEMTVELLLEERRVLLDDRRAFAARFDEFVGRYDKDSAVLRTALTGDLEGNRPGLLNRMAAAELKLTRIDKVVWTAVTAAVASSIAAIVGMLSLRQ